MFRRILFVFALSISFSLLGVPRDAAAQSPVTISENNSRINLLGHAAWLVDTQGILTLADVQQRRAELTPQGPKSGDRAP